MKILIPPVLGILVVLLTGRLYEGFPFARIWIFFLLIFSIVFLFFSRYTISRITKKVLKQKGYSSVSLIWDYNSNITVLKSLRRKTQKIIYGIFLLFSDTILLALSYYLAYFLRFKVSTVAELYKRYYVEENYIFYSFIFIIISILMFALYNLYDRDRIYRGSGYYSRLIKVIFINIVLIMLAGYVFNMFTFSRIWLLMLALFSLVIILAGRFFIEFITQKIINQFRASPRTIIIGIGENARRIEDSLKKYSSEGGLILGHIDTRERFERYGKYSSSFKFVGYLEDIKNLIASNNIHRVIIAGPEFKYFETLEMLEQLKGLDVTVLIFPGFFEFSMRRLSMREIGGVPLMQVANIGFFGFNLFLKNALDYLLGVIIFIIFIPIYLFVGMLIKLDSKGPVFFKQKRMTKDCRIFYMYKFRTMYIDAEERLKDLLQFSEVDGPIFKMKNDPRITRVGRFLRKFSIDELPQIINVLKGELSLVGPRPPIPSEVEKYEEWEMKRLNVKQGITGLWQISGRSELSFEEMTRLDLYYIQNWSIEMDIKIIIKTIPAVLFGKGAY
ncbi:MAG: sugar transferase [Actinobacteria bacterium]|nr:sugar transferase [Actinomycetota bacterium]